MKPFSWTLSKVRDLRNGPVAGVESFKPAGSPSDGPLIPVKEFEERGVENYPFRSLYVDDNDPFSNTSSSKSISLIQNWDSISDKDGFKKIFQKSAADFQ